MTLAKSIRLAFPVFLSCSLIACGGGSGFSAAETTDAATDTTTDTTSQNPDTSPSTTTPVVKSLSLKVSSFQLDSDGKTPVIITASAKDANNILLDGIDISIAVDNGASVTAFEGGEIKTASLTPSLYDNRLLTVTIQAEGLTETIQIAVVGTTLSLEGTQRMRLNTPTDYKILVRDSGGNPIGNRDISLPTIISGLCVVEPSSGSTLNSSGEYIFQISGAQEGKCTLSASAFGAESTLEIEVSDTSDPATTNVKSLSLSANSFQLNSDGKTPVIITASAKDANNVLLDGIDISIAVNNGASVTAFEGGEIKTASLTPSLYDNRLLTVTVQAEGITETIQVAVVGTTLSFEGTEKMRLNTPTDYKIIVRDSGGNPIGNQDIPLPTITSGLCVVESSSENTLNSLGEYVFQVSSTQSGKCTLEESAFGFEHSLEIEVSDFDLTLSSSTDRANDDGNNDVILEIETNKNENINVILTNKNSPAANVEILLSTTRGVIVNDKITTDADGKANFSIRSTDLGSATITAISQGITTVLNDIEFVVPEISNVDTLRLSVSSFQLESDGKIPVIISALAKDSSNVLLDNPIISLAVDSGADITAFEGTAIKTATLTPGLYDNRLLTVTAKAGNVTETIQVEVLGTTLALDGPQRMSLNTLTEYKILVRDSGNNPIGNQAITVPTISGSCSITEPTSGQQLNSAGEYVFQVSAAQGGICTLSASDFGSSSTLTIDVSGDEFTITPSTDKANDVANGDDAILEMPVNTDEAINLLLKQNGVAVATATVLLSSTRGVITDEVVTNAAGEASFTIQSANSGEAVITASTNGLTAVLKDLEFVATTPVYINTQASPSIVTPLGKSIVTTRIRDANDNPVKNKNITFNLSDTVGGSLNNSEAKTDSLGRASIEYTAGNTTSALDDVVITSTVQGVTTITDTVKLTVGGNALRVVLGTDNKLSKADVSYNQTFVVMVTDSAGNPIKDQNVNVAIVPTHYYKGNMIVSGESWYPATEVIPATDPITYDTKHKCETEDLNNNGQLDLGEDTDADNKLEPTHDASVAAVDASGKTGDDGTLLVTVSYPQSRALWSRQELVVRTSSNGTDYEEKTAFDLNILASDVSDKTVAPPNVTSPYGIKADCNSAD